MVRRCESGWNLLFESLASRRQRRQPLDLQVRAAAKEIDPLRREHGEVDRMTPPVRTAPIVVGQLVVTSKLPGAEEHAGTVVDGGVGGEGGDRATDEQG